MASGASHLVKAQEPILEGVDSPGRTDIEKGCLNDKEFDPLVHQNGQGDDDSCVWVDEGNAEEEERLSLGLIGKLWFDRVLNSNAFMGTIKNVWVTQYGVEINIIGKNLYQFQFYHWKDKERVLLGQPWHFDKCALLFAEMNEAQRPLDMEFYSLPMWVRIYNIPFRGGYNEDNARLLGNKIGEFVAMDRGFGLVLTLGSLYENMLL